MKIIYNKLKKNLNFIFKKYKNISTGFKVSVAEEGIRGLAKGWAPTLIGYSIQGVGKFGFYEAFKIFYANLLGEVNFHFLI